MLLNKLSVATAYAEDGSVVVTPLEPTYQDKGESRASAQTNFLGADGATVIAPFGVTHARETFKTSKSNVVHLNLNLKLNEPYGILTPNIDPVASILANPKNSETTLSVSLSVNKNVRNSPALVQRLKDEIETNVSQIASTLATELERVLYTA